MLVFTFLILPGLICAYAIFLRPILHNIPALAKFYADADGFWAKVWALCGNSLTMLWAHVLTLFGILLKGLDTLGPLLGDPDMKAQLTGYLQGNPVVFAYASMAIGIITLLARLRGILKAAAPATDKAA